MSVKVASEPDTQAELKMRERKKKASIFTALLLLKSC